MNWVNGCRRSNWPKTGAETGARRKGGEEAKGGGGGSGGAKRAEAAAARAKEWEEFEKNKEAA